MFGWATQATMGATSYCVNYGVPGSQNADSVYLDPVTVGAVFFKSNFRPDCKWTIWDNHEVSFDHDHGFGTQGMKRTANALFGGCTSTSRALYNFSTPLYYLVMRLKPHENPATRLFILCAWRGLITIACTSYGPTIDQENRITHPGNPQTLQYIRAVLATILEKGLKGEEIAHSKYRPFCWDENPLLNVCENYWATDEQFPKVQQRMISALVANLKGNAEDSEMQLNHLRKPIEQVRQKIAACKRDMGASGNVKIPNQRRGFASWYDHETLEGHISGADLKILHNKLWKWLQDVDPQIPLSYWQTEMGIPIPDEAQWRDKAPKEFWDWLALTPPDTAKAACPPPKGSKPPKGNK